jgi:hypothetical protein
MDGDQLCVQHLISLGQLDANKCLKWHQVSLVRVAERVESLLHPLDADL